MSRNRPSAPLASSHGADDGRIAQAPQRELAQGGGIGGRIGVAGLQVEHLGAGVGQQLALDEPALPRRAVERDDARPALARRDQHQRPAGHVGDMPRHGGQPARRRPARATGARSATPSTRRKRCATWFHSMSQCPGRPLRQRSSATRQRGRRRRRSGRGRRGPRRCASAWPPRSCLRRWRRAGGRAAWRARRRRGSAGGWR